MFKAIASDLDGTLLLHGAQELNPEIYDIISEFKKYGVTFIAASGRQLDSQKRLFAPVVNDIIYICENGALYHYNGETVVLTEINQEMVYKVVDEIGKIPGCKLLLSGASRCYILSGDDAFFHHIAHEVGNTTQVVDSFHDITEPIIKIAYFREENMEETVPQVRNLFSAHLKVVTSGNCWTDLVCYDCNKANALNRVLERIQINPKDVIAFGDQQNDVEMLELAGKSYAMSGAVPEAKACADALTDKVENTLLDLLNNFK